jgi:hypothetical protein
MFRLTISVIVRESKYENFIQHCFKWVLHNRNQVISCYLFHDVESQVKDGNQRQELPRRPGVDPGSVHVGFVLDKVALGQVFPWVLRFSPVNFIPPGLHYTEKWKKKLFVFLIGLHNKPEGCGASVASAAGPFKKKGKNLIANICTYLWRKKSLCTSVNGVVLALKLLLGRNLERGPYEKTKSAYVSLRKKPLETQVFGNQKRI